MGKIDQNDHFIELTVSSMKKWSLLSQVPFFRVISDTQSQKLEGRSFQHTVKSRNLQRNATTERKHISKAL